MYTVRYDEMVKTLDSQTWDIAADNVRKLRFLAKLKSKSSILKNACLMVLGKIVMSLLQISEPGQTPAPHQRRLAAGIDLGTTHTHLLPIVRSGQAEALSDSEGRYLLPSVVQYQVDNINVDWQAKQEAEKIPPILSAQ